jgi:hypothetical protein
MEIPRYKVLCKGKPVKVVVDLSFVIRSSKDDLVRWSRLQPLLFPAAFFLELFTHDSDSKQKEQQRCAYGKLSPFENLATVPNVGTLLRYERDNQLPAGASLSRFERIDLYLNPDMAAGLYQFPEDCNAVIDKLNGQVREASTMLPKLTHKMVERWFPNLASSCSGSQRQAVVSEITGKVAIDDELIRDIYRDHAPKGFPSADHIDQRWAIFWHTRFLLLLCLKHLERFHPNDPTQPSAKLLDNESLDLEYLILGALASNDSKTIRRFFKRACPKRSLFPR